MNRMVAFFARLFNGVRPASVEPMAMLECEEVMRSLWDYLDGELTPDRMQEIRAHIDMCKRCYPQYQFERSFLEALGARQPVHPHPELVRRKIMALLHAHGMTEG